MKNTIRYFFIVIFISAFSFPVNGSFAQIPEYNLFAKNFSLGSLVVTDDVLEFDIYILHTNAPATFEYAGGQYFIKINQLVADGGTMTYSILDSDLPPAMRPRSPSIGTASNPSATVLRLAANVFPGAGNGYILTGNTFPGTKIVRMRLANTVSFNKLECFQLDWRNPPIVAFATKIFAYIGIINTEVTTPETHSLDADQLFNECIHPVEMSTFTSDVNRNNVTLSWSTSEEINNNGFDIERKSFDGEWSKIGFIRGNGNTNEIHHYKYNDRSLNSGKYMYRLKQMDYNGNYEYHTLTNEVGIGVPDKFNLSQNYPNPFNPSTKIDFDLPKESFVKILLYDLSGREVALLVNEQKPAGYYSMQFDAANLSSGMYFYRITTDGGFVAVKKMMLLK